eukprot:COSAG01_NODE_2182_length_8212_cov_7.046838_11_plen_244_part_00
MSAVPGLPGTLSCVPCSSCSIQASTPERSDASRPSRVPAACTLKVMAENLAASSVAACGLPHGCANQQPARVHCSPYLHAVGTRREDTHRRRTPHRASVASAARSAASLLAARSPAGGADARSSGSADAKSAIVIILEFGVYIVPILRVRCASPVCCAAVMLLLLCSAGWARRTRSTIKVAVNCGHLKTVSRRSRKPPIQTGSMQPCQNNNKRLSIVTIAAAMFVWLIDMGRLTFKIRKVVIY